MSHKWKFILSNWINCYFNEGSKKEKCVNLESILTIISRLRENLNLDESKSSKLEAHTVEEFIQEKYPQFKFENGTVEATNEEEIHIVASLLLLFVCVNSKDLDIKHAMCSKLSSEDQETIMKFSKSLMECSPITYSDVQAAITEACGQEISAGESITVPKMVADTPPALRSLHGEVRRLQAALDAERFDRNYLQEELARTNLRLEKLLKDKEQYKLDILNLKAKISLCYGQEAEVGEGDSATESTSRLTRQLEDLEERLVATQEQLDDALMERNTYKSKVEQLKQERDKWLLVSQAEASRAVQLSQELETERNHVQSLRELVTELRQHNIKNCLDASQLECDDPDASIHSLHNASVCSEACANVIEVQLLEERAKINVLKHQIQGLQDQLSELNERAKNETQSLRSIIVEKDNDILNFKHRINEEIKEKNQLQSNFSDEISKLNNEINELEQKLKDNSESSGKVIKQKMQEIKTLQEEKLSLLQSLSDETTKLESIIKDLRIDIDTEKNLKLKMKGDYENQMMELNEKVLNTNNEQLELQNQIREKSASIEQLLLDLKKEKETKEELLNKCHIEITQLNERNNALERNLQQKCEEAEELQVICSEASANVIEVQVQLGEERAKLIVLEQQIQGLQDQLSDLNLKAETESQSLRSIIVEKDNDIINFKHRINEEIKEKNQMQSNFGDEMSKLNNEINELEQKLKNYSESSGKVIEQKMQEIKTLQEEKLSLLQSLSDETTKLESIIEDLRTDIDTEKKLKLKMKEDFESHINELNEKVLNGNNELLELQNKIFEKSALIEQLRLDLRKEQESKEELSNKYKDEIIQLNERNNALERNLQQKSEEAKELQVVCSEASANIIEVQVQLREERTKLIVLEQQIQQLQDQLSDLNQRAVNESQALRSVIAEKDNEIANIKLQINKEIEDSNQLKACFSDERSKLNNEINELQQKINDNSESCRKVIEQNMQEIKALQEEKLSLFQSLSDKTTELESIIKNLRTDIDTEKNLKFKMKEGYDNQMMELNEIVFSTNNELLELQNKIREKSAVIEQLRLDLINEKEFKEELVNKCNDDITRLNERNNALERNLQQKCEETKELQVVCSEARANVIEVQVQLGEERAKLIVLEQQIQGLQEQLSDLNSKAENETQSLRSIIAEKDNDIFNLKIRIDKELDEKNQLKAYVSEEISKLNNELQQKLKDIIESCDKVIKQKIQEIEILQEEKLSLLQSLSDETIKLESVIKNLRTDIDTEQNLKLKMKEDYENQLMELNEKVSDTNNELLELQNKIREKSALIGQLRLDLIKEKETKEELLNECNDNITQLNERNNALERSFQQKCEEVKELQVVNSEACANVIEVQVQLGEERTKIIVLEQQIQELQDQLSDLNLKTEKETQSLRSIISEKDNEILNFKHQIDEGIEENNQLKAYFDDEMSKLNNELEQKLKDSESCEKLIEQKLQEIETLQEEKLSLLQSLTDKTTKFETIIKDLRTDNDTNKNLKLKIKEDHENQMMELNKKLLNKNNELLELQNKICEKSALIKQLRLDLIKEKESKEELSNKYNDDITQLNERNNTLERNLQQKCEEAKELQVVCSEAGANVIEVQVQLREERATIIVLEQQIQELQDQLSDLNLKTENESQSLRSIVAEKDNEIFNLKHQIDKEIEEKNQLKAYFSDEMIKLNNELEQKLKDNSESCDKVIKQKMQEIETVQGEKLSLLQSLSDETTKLEFLINDLRTDIDTEKNLKLKMKEDYENRMMELNEKVLNRNNELLELQNKMCEKSELIEKLRIDLIREKETKEELSNKCNDNITQLNERNNALERNLQQKCEEAEEFQAVCSEACANVIEVKLGEERAKIIVLEQQIQGLQDQISDLNERAGNETLSLRNIIAEKDNDIFNLKHQINKEIEEKNQLKAYFSEETSILNNVINELEQKLKDNNDSCETAMEQKMEENKTLQEEKLRLLQSLSDKTTKFETIIEDLRIDIDTEKNLKLKMKEDCENHMMKLNEKVLNRNNELLELQNKICEKSALIEQLRLDLIKEKETKEELSNKCNDNIIQLNERNIALERNLQQKCEKAEEFQAVCSEACANVIEVKLGEERAKIIALEQQIQGLQDQLSDHNLKAENETHSLRSIIAEKDNDIFNLKIRIDEEIEEKNQLKAYVSEEISKLNNELQQKLKDNSESCEKFIKEKMQEIETLQDEKLSLLQSLSDEATKFETIIKDLRTDIDTEKYLKLKMKEDYDNHVKELSEKVLNRNNEVLELQNKLSEKSALVEELRLELIKERESKEELANKCNDEITQLNKRNNELDRNLQQKCEEAKELQVAMTNQEKSSSNKYSGGNERHQVSMTTSDLTHSSMESFKTINDLEKIIHDKNRMITTLQSDISYIKSLMAESENKLLDVNKELEVSQETCQQLSSQLKKIVHQKNEEIADLRRQVTKMSVTESRASQIIKVSAKYQAIILKRIAEIKSNTVLKELTNFGNTANSENELKRSLNSAITIEDLENFLETTDRHLKRCTEKQLALQKDKDRLTEVNRINESEIISMKKFLTELSLSFKTFNSVKELYVQKLSRVVSVQRTVRREILDLDGRITDAMMCKLERGYAAILQDLSECAMNLERWVERCIGRTISAEKIKQAFSCESDRTSLATFSFQNTSLEVQLEELEKSFQKLLEEIMRAQKGEGAKNAQAVTVMEVRAEYEDKLNRMKAKMKQLYQEQIAIFRDKQKDEVAALERELHRTRERLAECSRANEEHITSLTNELWRVGEKFLMKKDEAEWLRRKQRSVSLMSLQHVHSSGLVPPPEEPSRPSDTHSLRSLPVHTNNTIREKREGREGRGLHMSDEEGEVFDNRWLKELSATPRREPVAPPPPGQRLSELQWRNSLCLPHLKSSYPAETQFVDNLQEEDIKCVATANEGKQQRKEVGITAYKKPGPPTPSKQAGRLSATGSELREWQRVEAEPQPARKTATPSRLFNMFRSARNDTNEGTPRSRRLSNIFRKK